MIYIEDLKRYIKIVNPNKKITLLAIITSFFSVRMLPVLIIRISFFLKEIKLGVLAKFFSLLNMIFFGLECSTKSKIGSGLFIPHSFGIVIGAFEIGKNATIYQGVTIGAKELDFTHEPSSRPIIGDDVTIASGAKILGGISIGDNVMIAANAVVVKHVASRLLVGGVPAKIIKHR
jgi:serine O-acetyltransferase